MLPRPGVLGYCPNCNRTLIAKCGEIKMWHFAHDSLVDCDPWWEPESQWHLQWKSIVRPGSREVVIGNHRADMIGNGGVVVELQHSPLAPSVVREREGFYGNMMWIVDAKGFRDNVDLRDRTDFHTFRWKWPRRWMNSISKPLYWDFGEDWGSMRLFRVHRIHDGPRVGGWGVLVPVGAFRDEFLSRVLA